MSIVIHSAASRQVDSNSFAWVHIDGRNRSAFGYTMAGYYGLLDRLRCVLVNWKLEIDIYLPASRLTVILLPG